MAPEQTHEEAARALEEFEREWQSGSEPDVARYAGRSSGLRFLADLIEIDLEYRWRRFESSTCRLAGAADGLPAFPLLDDYAALLPPQRSEVLSPSLIAAEYRVRTQWGDRPGRDEFLNRLPDARREVETALNAVDTEFDVEDVTPRPSDSSLSAAMETTIAHRPAEPSRSLPTDERVESGPLEEMRLGRYLLERCVGRGGFGEVWKAWDPDLERVVAVKILRADGDRASASIGDVLREGREIARLGQSPGIVGVFDTGESDGVSYIVSEYIEGENLEQRISRERYSHEEAARLIAEIASALHRAHLKGVVHRDVKPANILLDAEGTPHVGDFGLAVTEEELLSEIPQTVGTFAYMSPEQARGDSHLADPRSDVYSLGVMLYRMLSGRLPFVWRNFAEFQRQIREREPRPLRAIDDGIPQRLEEICLKCLRRSIGERYTTALELAEELRQWLREARRPRKPRWIAAAVLGLCAVGIGAAVAIPQFQAEIRPQVAGVIGNVPPLVGPISWKNPQTVTWAADATIDFRGYDSLGRQYRFDTDGHSLFEVAEVRENDIELQTTFALKDWVGYAGVFWSLNYGDDGDEHCWVISAGRPNADSSSDVGIAELTIQSIGGGKLVTSRSTFERIPFPLPDGNHVNLRVQVIDQTVRQIWMNGKALLDEPILLPKRDWSSPTGSSAGYYGFTSTVSVFGFETEE